MSEIIIISGSPSEKSSTERILYYMGNLLQNEGFKVMHISVRDVPGDVLIEGEYDSPEILEIAAILRKSKGVIAGSPVYKGAYSGVLKALMDVLPEDVLKHTPVLPVMTGGSGSHLLALEYSFKPLLASLKAHNLKGLYFSSDQIDKMSDIPINDSVILKRTQKQLNYLTELVNNSAFSSNLQ